MMPPRQGWEALQERLLFLPPLPEQLDPLALFALLLVAGLLVGETLFRRFGLSRIVGYVLAGAISGPGALGWLDRETIALAKPLADTALGLLLILRGLLQVVTHLLKTLNHLFLAGLQLFLGQFAGRQQLTQFKDRSIFRVCGEQGALFGQTTLAFSHALHAGFQLLNTRLQDFGLALRLSRAQVEGIPLLLPGMHGDFGFFERRTRLFGGGTGERLLGFEHRQFFTQRGQQRDGRHGRQQQ